MPCYIELHAHLDGSVTPTVAAALAKMQGIVLPEGIENRLRVSESCADLNEFLRCFSLPLSLLQTEEALSEAVVLVLSEFQNDGVIYAELRFAPQLHTERGLSQEAVIRAALHGLSRAPIPANLILCAMRGKDARENEETLRLTEKFAVTDGGVVAFDLAGAEALFPTRDYRSLLEKAHALSLPFTVHAGEAGSAEDVKIAVEAGASRIGHGVRMASDPSVCELVREKGVFPELCPTGNFLTHACDRASYPLIPFLEQGIRATLNTDDPAIANTTLSREFALAETEFGLTAAQKKTLLFNAADAAFTSPETKKRLRAAVLQG